MSVIAVRPGGFGSHLPHPLPPTHPFLWGGGGCIGTCTIWGKSGLLMRTKRVAQMTKVSNCGGHDSGIDYSRYKIRRTAFTRFEGHPLPDSKDSLYQIRRTAFTRLRRTAFTRLRRTAFTVYVWFIGQICVNFKMPDMPYGYRCIHSNRDSLFKKKKIQIILEGRKKHSSYKVS